MNERDQAGHERFAATRQAIGLVADLGGSVAALSVLLALAVGLAGLLVGLTTERPGLVLFGGGLVIGVALGAALMRLALGRRRQSSVEAQRGYRWVQATYTYVIGPDDPHRHTQWVDVRIQAVRDMVRTFTNQYRWSGSGDEDAPEVRSPGHAVVGPVRRALGWKSYDIRLDPALRRGEATTVSLVQVLHDKGEKFDLYLGKSVYESMDRLVLRVELPSLLRPERSWGLEREGAGPEAPQLARAEVPTRSVDEGTVIEWVVPRPTIGHNYVLSWEYGSERGMYEAADPGGDAG